jgi:23S rRNA pseudouridine1911/1915/1917 synthase
MNCLMLESQASECLLVFLLRSLSGWKRGTVKDRLSRGAVRVNGEVVKRHDHRLQRGDRVEILPPRMAPTTGGERAGIRLLYGDAHLVVIDKPAGLLSVAAPLEHEMTAMRQTRLLLEERGSRAGRRLWAVHRLDQETSGALMMARSQAVQQHFRNHWKQVEKLYLAIVENPPAEQSGRIDARLREGEDRRVRVVRSNKTSKAALTLFRTVKRSGRYGLLEIALLTGRKHQIRVHLSAAGHPILGDALYGSGHDPLGRLALHSHRLSFTHPFTQERITVVSPLPAPMARFVRGWGTQ